MPATRFTPTPRTKAKRRRHLAFYDRATIDAILDEGLVAHVGFVADGYPCVIPITYGRDGDRLLFHGSAGSRTLRTLGAGADACVCVSLLDGLVFARSAFNQDMNYRSVVLFGAATEIRDPEEKTEALHRLVEHIMPGRWADVRSPTVRELKQTRVLSFPIDEASAKVRTGPPIDEEEDYGHPAWAGEIAMTLTPGKPVRDPRCDESIAPPRYVSRYRRPTAS